MGQEVYAFIDNLIWIGNRKFSLLVGENSQFPVMVLSSRPKISELIKNNLL